MTPLEYMPACSLLRAYPAGYADAIFNLHQEFGQKRRKPMRQKVQVDGSKTDQELFKELPLGDLWQDAALPSVYLYLLRGRTLVIPDAWYDTMMDLKKEMEKHANWLQL